MPGEVTALIETRARWARTSAEAENLAKFKFFSINAPTRAPTTLKYDFGAKCENRARAKIIRVSN
jgi:hypothetical protein